MNSRLAALAATALLAACVESAPDRVVNGVAVVTQQKPGNDFTQYTTFAVNPAIAVIDQTGSVSKTYTVTGTDPVVNTITQIMKDRGYTPVAWPGANGRTADLQIQMSAFLGSADVYYPGYCGWYPYYYCYPGWTYAGSYSFGTLVVDMADVKNAPPVPAGGEIPLVWSNANYGILSSYYSTTTPGNGANVNWARINEAVTRAFDQSPFIRK